MFCPKCKAEYRQGFTHCADCDVDLLEVLPPQHPGDAGTSADDRPDKASPRVFVAWFAPMVFFCAFYFLALVRPTILHNFFFASFLFAIIFLQTTGAFWMLYQAVRYEERMGRYVLLSLVPFMFVWYSLVRTPLRKEMPRIP
jgi:hypothetical protein